LALQHAEVGQRLQRCKLFKQTDAGEYTFGQFHEVSVGIGRCQQLQQIGGQRFLIQSSLARQFSQGPRIDPLDAAQESHRILLVRSYLPLE